jgi:hypothetical protein
MSGLAIETYYIALYRFLEGAMKKLAFLYIALLLAIAFSRSFVSFAMTGPGSLGASVALSRDEDLLVKVKKNKKKNNNGGEANPATPNTEPQGTPNTEASHDCPVGYVVLDKPNQYGSFCEQKEGVCKNGLIGTPPNCTCPEGTLPLGPADRPCVAKENCPFPGQVWNPPNCDCPKGTEFVGYKGCVKYEDKSTCEVETADTVADVSKKLEAFTANCTKMQGIVKGPSDSVRVEPGEKPMIPLCCIVRYYEK